MSSAGTRNMNIRNSRSGVSLVLTGLLGAVFFWATDHRYGIASQISGSPGSIDQANQMLTGTLIGIAGSLIVFGIGVWLVSKRSQ